MFSHCKIIISIAACVLAAAACTSSEGQTGRSATISQSAPDGMAVYRKYCVSCHGADGKLGLSGAKDLTQCPLTKEERIRQISKGKGLMTPFEEILSPEEIEAVAEFTLTLKPK